VGLSDLLAVIVETLFEMTAKMLVQMLTAIL